MGLFRFLRDHKEQGYRWVIKIRMKILDLGWTSPHLDHYSGVDNQADRALSTRGSDTKPTLPLKAWVHRLAYRSVAPAGRQIAQMVDVSAPHLSSVLWIINQGETSWL